jgi:GntR family transcriptional regulator/MocR family aminotransferase
MKERTQAKLEIDRDAKKPMARQIYVHFRAMILSGDFPAGSRMPSTRRIALESGVSRNTVMAAFQTLLGEGYLEARRGKGTFVASSVTLSAQPTAESAALPTFDYKPHRFDAIDFRAGVPDLSRFPVKTWRRLSREVWTEVAPLDLTYSQPEGRIELRTQIAEYLCANRGERCHPDQILVTCGATQAMGIVGRMLLQGERKACLMEDPSAADFRRIISSLGGRIVPVPVDMEGLVTEALPADALPAFISVSPSHQFPLGVTMPLKRKVRLLEYARRKKTYIIENDYDCELRYDSPPSGSLQGMDPARVVRVGTFSATLYPSIRIGYVVLPPELITLGREIKWFADLHNATVDQLILARFIASGSFAHYQRVMRKTYRRTRTLLLEALERHFGGDVEILGSAAGLHLCARFPGIKFTFKILNRINLAGVGVYPVEEHAIRKGRWENTIILGYGMLDTRRINVGISILKRCLPLQ